MKLDQKFTLTEAFPNIDLYLTVNIVTFFKFINFLCLSSAADILAYFALFCEIYLLTDISKNMQQSVKLVADFIRSLHNDSKNREEFVAHADNDNVDGNGTKVTVLHLTIHIRTFCI